MSNTTIFNGRKENLFLIMDLLDMNVVNFRRNSEKKAHSLENLKKGGVFIING